MLSSRVVLTIVSASLLVHQRRWLTSCSESWMQLHVSSQTPEIRPRSDAASTRRSTLVGCRWSHHVQTVRLRLSVLTRHGAVVPVRTVPVCFGVWRTSLSAVIGPQSTRRTSLQSGNRRQTCVWLCRTESVQLTPGLLEMRRPRLETFKRQLKSKDVFVRTLLAHLAH